jgi:hypothetical protein
MYVLTNITAGNWLSVNNIDDFGNLSLVVGEIILASKFIILERKSSVSTVNKDMSIKFEYHDCRAYIV